MTVKREHTQVFLYPGNVTVSKQPQMVTTILGSCVAVCLWDARLEIGGMNHYLLPLWNGRGLKSPKYGNIAIEILIRKMQELGSDIADLQAKVFGGAQVLDAVKKSFQVGEENILIAQDLLRSAGIPIVGSSTGGKQGVKILFFTESGKVLLKRIHATG